MARKKALDPVLQEIIRLNEIYSTLPPKKLAVASGMIIQAARIKVHLDELEKDISENGLYEMFSQSESQTPYQRTRPAADLFIKLDKNYQAIIKQLNDICPAESTGSKLDEFKKDSDSE